MVFFSVQTNCHFFARIEIFFERFIFLNYFFSGALLIFLAGPLVALIFFHSFYYGGYWYFEQLFG